MRIGLFTETYRPSINGIVFVVESTKRHLEALGHEVYVFCPARSMRPSKNAEAFEEDEHTIRFPSFKGAFYDDYDMSIFFPPRVLRKIRELDLDIIHIFTPGQVGMIGAYAAFKTDTPLVAQHSTDLFQYVEHYPSVLPGLLAICALLPFTIDVDGKDRRELLKLYRPRRGATAWNRDIVEKTVTLVYSKCDAVIALSRKSKRQLESWQNGKYHYELTMLPNGVDALKKPTERQLDAFKETWNIGPKDEIITFVGRLGAEKNLAMLIPTLELVLKSRPNAKLMYVGDFEFREALEEMARESPARDRIIFTGMIPRNELGVAYAVSKLLAFPSFTDTQGWVVHEAAHAGLPIILVDPELSEVLEDGKNGYLVQNDSEDMAAKIVKILKTPKLYAEFSAHSKVLARKFTEKQYAKSLQKVYFKAIKAHFANPRVDSAQVESIEN